MTDIGISTPVNSCLRLFKLLLSLDGPTRGITPEKAIIHSFREEQARFKVWVGNIGAHKTGRSSLEYRLRDASHIKKQVIELISDLASSLENARTIISGEKTPWDQLEDDGDHVYDDPSSDSDSVDEDFPKTELDQTALSVADVINCLLRLSVAIRNPAPHDRFASSIPAIDTEHYEPFDVQHVQGKFGQVSESLAMRLGKAISRRRQYFKYRERHHQKLSEGISAQEIIPSNVPKDTVSTIASSIPMETKDAAFDLSRLATVDEDAFSDSGFSQTSYASSVAGSATLKIPPIPKEAHNGPFECPFCFMMITASTTVSWRRHVFGDLRPYICLAEHCADAGREFARRHEWTAHELQNHWKKYVCPAGCNKEFFSISRCKEHLGEAHPDSIPPNQVDVMISLSARPLGAEDGIQCPLCQDQLSSFKQYQRHVGRHQEQLALFALPPLDSMGEGEDDENDSSPSEVGESSAEGSKASDKIVAAENLETEHEDAGPSPENTDVLDKPKSDSFDDELFERLQAEARATELQFKYLQDTDQFRRLLLQQMEASKDGSSGKVKRYSPQKCIEPSCEQRQCTSQDEKDPKRSLYCREHVCPVPGCVRSRVKTLDARGLVPVERFEAECSEHWVIPDVVRREGLTSTRDEDRDIPADRATLETDPKGKGKGVAHQESFEVGGMTQGQDSAQGVSGISGLGAPSLEKLRQLYDPQDIQGRTDSSETLRQMFDQQNKLDQIKAQTIMAEAMNQVYRNSISQMSLRDNVGLGYTRDPGDILEKDPSPLNEDEDINAGVPAHAGGSIEDPNSPWIGNEGRNPKGRSESSEDQAAPKFTKEKPPISTRVPTSIPSISVTAGDTPRLSVQRESIPSPDSLPRKAEDFDSLAATSTEGITTSDTKIQGTKERTSVGRVSTSEEEKERRLEQQQLERDISLRYGIITNQIELQQVGIEILKSKLQIFEGGSKEEIETQLRINEETRGIMKKREEALEMGTRLVEIRQGLWRGVGVFEADDE